MNRREFVKIGGAAMAALAGGLNSQETLAATSPRKPRPKNILLIITDQQHIDTIRAAGCPHVHTPGLDRLKNRGVSFTQSYTSNPVCSPARSSIFSGRTSCECSVHVNGRPIHSDIPNLGQWFSEHTDYEAVYAGKWHLPRTYTDNIPGFRVIHTGIGGFGYLCDTMMSRACEAFIRNRARSKPFLMVASFMQPHDICEWLRLNTNEPEDFRYPEIADKLPDLPDNFEYDRNEPETVRKTRLSRDPFVTGWSKQQWRYYRWSYFRHIEQVDAEIGRVLQALDDCGYTDETLIVFTADHGEGMGHHQMVRKSTLYNEAARVPLIISWPGHVPQGRTDTVHLASGMDIMPTLCDYAGIKTPQQMRGMSIRPVLQGDSSGHEFVVTEVSSNTGRMLRSPRYKYVTYLENAVEQLFDMQNDPGETKNLAQDSGYASALNEHRSLLRQWESRLQVPGKVPHGDVWRGKV